MGSTETIMPGDTVEFTPAEWRGIPTLAGTRKVLHINYINNEPFYRLDCGNIQLEATRFEIKKIEK